MTGRLTSPGVTDPESQLLAEIAIDDEANLGIRDILDAKTPYSAMRLLSPVHIRGWKVNPTGRNVNRLYESARGGRAGR